MNKNPNDESYPFDVPALNRYLKRTPEVLAKIVRTILNKPKLLIYGLNIYEEERDSCVFEIISIDSFNRLHTVLILFDQTGEIEEMVELSRGLFSEHQKRDPVNIREVIDIIIITPDKENRDRLYIMRKDSKIENKSCQVQVLNQLYRGENRIGRLFSELQKL